MKSELFDELFVLELANNHWGDLRRGLTIIRTFAELVNKYQVKAAIKLQFRDAGTLIHKDYKGRTDIRYIHRTEARILSEQAYRRMVEEIKAQGMLTMSTPFDEASVDLCEDMDIDIIKIASFDLNDWPLVHKVLATKRPTIVSIGGTGIEDIDHIVDLFNKAKVPLAINQCVSIYPSEPGELELNQLAWLVGRYPDNVIGLSSHEYKDFALSLAVAYGMGARTFERHIDIPHPTHMAAYNMLPEQCETWFKAYRMIREICGPPVTALRVPPRKEMDYIYEHVRGLYAKRDLVPGDKVDLDNFYMAVPIHQGQLSCREVLSGGILTKAVPQDAPLMMDSVSADYLGDKELVEEIGRRGMVYDKAK
ncbi:MAG: N-acetylneuraminate synthase family protein [Methanomassiliicoccales archaeon]|nr:N-acetylneuraminate synthase family protein [Methanomassiliicoccales archaeon]